LRNNKEITKKNVWYQCSLGAPP